MKIPRYWEKQAAEQLDARGNRIRAEGWGWSQDSIEEARTKATKTAERIVQWLAGDSTNELNHYGYDERLPREEIVDEYLDDQGKPVAFVSRNGYGSLILNTRELMFIDIDFPPEPRSPKLGFFASLFGKPKAVEANPEETTLAKIRNTASQFPDFSFRVYRTFNGFRLMLANRKFSADSAPANELLSAFQSDPLYVRMCRNQQCFRARLTPKAWRCKIEGPPARFPFGDKGAESQYRKWESIYNQGVRNFATCKYIETIGPDGFDESHEHLISLHDQLSNTSSNDSLA